MKLWKKQVNLYYFTSPCSHLSFFSLELPSLPQFEVILFSPVLALHLLAPLLAVLSPVVLLCSFSTAGPSIGREALGAVALQLASRTEKQGGSRKRGTAASPGSSAPSATQHRPALGAALPWDTAAQRFLHRCTTRPREAAASRPCHHPMEKDSRNKYSFSPCHAQGDKQDKENTNSSSNRS